LSKPPRLWKKLPLRLKKLPHSRQRQLLPLRLQGLISDPVSQDLRLGIFLNELELAASSASLQAMRLRVWRSGGRQNYRKQEAATCALLLLAHFGQRPTLTGSGPFFVLASVLYEAATGEPNIDLDGQCRAAHKQLPHRTVEQRRK
jgi:hypothetical protein